MDEWLRRQFLYEGIRMPDDREPEEPSLVTWGAIIFLIVALAGGLLGWYGG